MFWIWFEIVFQTEVLLARVVQLRNVGSRFKHGERQNVELISDIFKYIQEI
jgi:hypothetical protein